jgi:hypothetical protein
VSPYVRTVKTSSGATAVQIVYSSHGGSREIEYLGSAHSGAEVELLKAAAWQRRAGRTRPGLGYCGAWWSAASHVFADGVSGDALAHVYRVLGFDEAAGGDGVFAQFVLARIIEPTSKLDSARVPEETVISAPSYRTLLRRLPAYAKPAWRQWRCGRWPRSLPAQKIEAIFTPHQRSRIT